MNIEYYCPECQNEIIITRQDQRDKEFIICEVCKSVYFLSDIVQEQIDAKPED
jgi:uncharacterized protein YbaR (Trm112 family)